MRRPLEFGLRGKICVDLDGVIAEGADYPFYADCRVVSGAVEYLESLRDSGWYIIIYTSRWEQDREVTEWWLKAHQIPFDKLILGKPLADIYLDDKAIRFTSWEEVWNEK